MEGIHAAPGMPSCEVTLNSASPVAWSTASTVDRAIPPASTVDIPCSSSPVASCQGTDNKNHPRESSAMSNRSEVIVPPRSSVSAITSLLTQKLESNMAQEHPGFLSRPSMRREAKAGEEGVLASASALPSRLASTLQNDIAVCSVKERQEDAAPAPVAGNVFAAAAALSKVPNAPGSFISNARRNTTPGTRIAREEHGTSNRSGAAVPEEEKARLLSVPVGDSKGAQREIETVPASPMWARIIRQPHDPLALPPISGGSMNAGANAPAADAQNAEIRQAKTLPLESTTSTATNTTTASPAAPERPINNSQQDALNVRGVLKPAKLVTGSPPSLREVDLVGRSGGSTACRLPLLPCSPHSTLAVSPRTRTTPCSQRSPRQLDEGKGPMLDESMKSVKTNGEQPMPSATSPPRGRSIRRANGGANSEVKVLAAAAAAHASPPLPRISQMALKRLPQAPSAASGGAAENTGLHTAAATAVAAAPPTASTEGMGVPPSSSCQQLTPLSPAVLPAVHCTADSEPTKERHASVHHYSSEAAGGAAEGEGSNAAQPTCMSATPSKVSPSKRGVHKAAATKPPAAAGGAVGEEGGKTPPPRQSCSSFRGAPDTPSPKPKRGKSGASSRVAVVRWVLAAVNRPSTATVSSSSAIPRDVDVSVMGSHVSGVRESSFSLFSAYQVARTVVNPSLPVAVPSSPVAEASVEPMRSIQCRWIGLDLNEDAREKSTSVFGLEPRCGRSTTFKEQLHASRKGGARPLADVKQTGQPTGSSFSEDTMNTYTKLSFTAWPSNSIGSTHAAAAAAAAGKNRSSHDDGQLEVIEDSVQVEAPTVREDGADSTTSTTWTYANTEASVDDHNDRDRAAAGKSSDDDSGGAMEPSDVATSTPSSSGIEEDDSSSAVSRDTRSGTLQDFSATLSISEQHALTQQAKVKDVRTSDVANTLQICREAESIVSFAGVYRGDGVLDSSITAAPPSSAATPPLAKPPQKRHLRREFFTSPGAEAQSESAMRHPSPHVVMKAAGNKSVNSSMSFSVYNTTASAAWSLGVQPLLSAEGSAWLLQQQQPPRSSPSLNESDTFALSALGGSVAGLASGLDRRDEDNVVGEPENEAFVDRPFSIGSDFADHNQAAVDRYNYESLWSCSVFDSDESESDESELNSLLRVGYQGNSAGEVAGIDSDAKRRRRLLPVSAFRHYYIPEDFITESRVSATYKVRERRTHRHFAATFVLYDPGCRGGGAAAPSKVSLTSEMKTDAAGNATLSETAVQQPMSLDLKRFCAMSLMLQHPNLIQTFDVFYREVGDAEQMSSLVRACTSASGDEALTWEPEIEKPAPHIRSRSTVSLRLPAVSVAEPALVHAEASRPASQRSSTVSVLAPDSFASRSGSLHSVEESHHDEKSTRRKKSKTGEAGTTQKKYRSSATPKEAGQHGGSSLIRHLFSSFFGSAVSNQSNSAFAGRNRKKNATAVSPSENEERGATKLQGGPGEGKSGSASHSSSLEGSPVGVRVNDSGTVPGFQWPAEAAAELARRERRVAELRASRTSADRAKAAERRARVEHLATLLVSGRVVAVLISELVQDDTVKAAASLWGEAQRNGGLSETQLMAVTRGVAGALNYLHSFRMPRLAIVHGAVEPRNVVYGSNGVVKLVNYACMHWWLSEEESHVKGKYPDHASRELPSTQDLQLLLKGWSHASPVLKTAPDMYGLGCTLLTLASGMPLGYSLHLFHSNAFPAPYPSLQSLLKGLLEEKSTMRMTAEAVLCHPFASTLGPTPTLPPGALEG
ncbi:hypothetical protein ABL78_2582 [Leptomonas seymouri]|uniref:Protein kinase domain-containing protein n=1 Tax=Leptomonas seymouri TaxID=5684 RepID=A0A0N1I929_LEPSE|nr:hypothetical protein ABL78_2582 [Leptomonas seymouri]|eukprot:KPI88343.1 hypothetical protein ABL78_2582 [Leptomonas seymouri]